MRGPGHACAGGQGRAWQGRVSMRTCERRCHDGHCIVDRADQEPVKPCADDQQRDSLRTASGPS
jgi:hypothetical protein